MEVRLRTGDPSRGEGTSILAQKKATREILQKRQSRHDGDTVFRSLFTREYRKKASEGKLSSCLMTHFTFSRCVHNCFAGEPVFNLEWTPDGEALVAVGQSRSIQIYDARVSNGKKIVQDAHRDCVNIVRFLDPTHFVTGSDDTTLRLWDLRCMERGGAASPVNIFEGHSEWVKNIEVYKSPMHVDKKYLLSAAFDGTVRLWDIQREYRVPTPGTVRRRDRIGSFPDNIVYQWDSLARARLRGDMLIVSHSNGYVLLIHNFHPLQRLDKFQEEHLSTRIEGMVACVRGETPELLQERNLAGYTASIQVSPNSHTVLPEYTDKGEGRFLLTRKSIEIEGSEDSLEESCVFDLSLPPPRARAYTAGGESDVVYCAVNLGPDRMLAVVRDSDSGRGYIKEPCFSSCGRYMCSPYYSGVRLFKTKAIEDIPKTEMRPVEESSGGQAPFRRLEPWKAFLHAHAKDTLTCKFHPHLPTLCSGGMDSAIAFYEVRF